MLFSSQVFSSFAGEILASLINISLKV